MPSTNLRILTKFKEVADPATQFIVVTGGRGGGKSEAIATKLIGEMLIAPPNNPTRILCLRELKDSATEASYAKILRVIRKIPNWKDLIKVTKATITCRANGSHIMFSGMRDLPTDRSKIKGVENIKYFWLDEADRFSKNNIMTIIGTMREAGVKCFFSFNPQYETDEIYQLFFQDKVYDDITTKLHVNYCDLPEWVVSPEFKRMAESLKESNYEDYQWTYLGIPKKTSDALIFRHIFTNPEEIPKPKDTDEYFGGIDFGLGAADTAVILFRLSGLPTTPRHQRDLIIVDEFVSKRIPSVDELYEEISKMQKGRLVRWRCDKQYSNIDVFLQTKNVDVMTAEKGKNSIMVGIRRIKEFNSIIIDPKCIHTIKNFTNYSYKIKEGIITREPEDKNNDCIDAIRYGLEGASEYEYTDAGSMADAYSAITNMAI